MKKSLIIPLCTLITQIESVVLSSEFHIFDVGQGNCQLSKYYVQYNHSNEYGQSVEKTERIGFLYDCGNHKHSQKSGSHKSRSQTLSDAINKDMLTDLDLLVTILSYPNVENINSLSGLLENHYAVQSHDPKKRRSSEKPFVSFLCGDWGQSKDSVASTKKRLADNSIETYSWKNSDGSPEFFSDNIVELWSKAKSQTSHAKQLLLSKFDNAIAELRMQIYIWSMNTKHQSIDNQNAANPIISFTHSYLKYNTQKQISLLCAGNAEHSTALELVQSIYKNNSYFIQTIDKVQKNKEMQEVDVQNAVRYALPPIDDVLLDGDVVYIASHRESEQHANTIYILNSMFKFSAIYISNGNEYPNLHRNFYDQTIKSLEGWSINYVVAQMSNMYNAKTYHIAYNYDQSNLNNLIKFNLGKNQANTPKIITTYESKSNEIKERECPNWLYSTSSHGSASSVLFVSTEDGSNKISNVISNIMKREYELLTKNDYKLVKSLASLLCTTSIVDYATDSHYTTPIASAIIYPYIVRKLCDDIANISFLQSDFTKKLGMMAQLPLALDFIMGNEDFYWSKLTTAYVMSNYFCSLSGVDNVNKYIYNLLSGPAFAIMYHQMLGSNDEIWDTKIININYASIPIKLALSLLYGSNSILQNVVYVVGYVFYDFFYNIFLSFTQLMV
ncbi:hypothetical protein [Candidatus Cytomitobacter primus]|uniref:Uncharacterized protein n=1 Tax=Candidatus Cytomitobacter primus TaxID=2066024 RepID=A0A5C0UEX1_9PROT|nr:hypothetical protein [Candidatus Cytomitobacter primus]QEK38645.1 hypothetical protein FZC34_01845 [Candidatus Cytomitobacter primus]